ncbi:MAG: tetratricopeptide repeat protein, partial [Cyanobacteria bacterium P01_D01_bin.116]
IASASADKTVKLWSLDDQLLHSLQGHKYQVWNVRFSPDGKTIASASYDSTVKLWSVDGQLLHTLQGHKDEVWDVRFSTDGKTIASEYYDSTVKLWSVDVQLLHTLQGYKSEVYDVRFSPDGKTIASTSQDKTVKLWDWNFDNLLTRGCNQFQDYLVEHPKKLEELKVCQNPEILAKAPSTLVKQGEELGKNGDYKGAVEKFKQAQQLDAKVDLNPRTKELDDNAETAAASAFVYQGEELVRKGDYKGAVEKFKQAQQLDAKVDLNPQTKELDSNPEATAAIAVVTQGQELVRKGDYKGAVENFKQAQQLDAKVDLHPRTKELDNNPEATAAIALVIQGEELVGKGDVKEAIAAYNKALKINPNLQISGRNWSVLCWDGSSYNHAKDVMFACEKAVALADEDEYGYFLYGYAYAYAHSSRGLARALTGDYKGAIEDFEMSLKWTNNPKGKSQLQSWIKDLRNDKNPFTPEVLEELRKQ